MRLFVGLTQKDSLMTSQTQTASYDAESRTATSDRLLRGAFRFNAIVSAAFAVLWILAGALVSEFIGLDTPVLGMSGGTFFNALGILFIPFIVLLGVLASRETIPLPIAWGIFIVDSAWVVLSFVLLITDALGLNTAGSWAMMLQADLVIVISIAEFIGIRRLRQTA
jgi:hypothetical protein